MSPGAMCHVDGQGAWAYVDPPEAKTNRGGGFLVPFGALVMVVRAAFTFDSDGRPGDALVLWDRRLGWVPSTALVDSGAC